MRSTYRVLAGLVALGVVRQASFIAGAGFGVIKDISTERAEQSELVLTRARLRAVLDITDFPGPLKLIASWFKGWDLSSDWYAWVLAS